MKNLTVTFSQCTLYLLPERYAQQREGTALENTALRGASLSTGIRTPDYCTHYSYGSCAVSLITAPLDVPVIIHTMLCEFTRTGFLTYQKFADLLTLS
jgi:hypothetical protein